jgi:hypothetical protein
MNTLQMKKWRKRRNNLKQVELCSQIEELREELKRLIDLGADFGEIYEVSLKLDELIVVFYRNALKESI